jgi:hypothetical protein
MMGSSTSLVKCWGNVSQSEGVFVTPQRTAGWIWLSFPHNVTEYGGPTEPLCLQPPPPSYRRRRRCRTAVASAAMLPSLPSCCRCNRHRTLPLLPPHFCLRRHRAAAKLLLPLPSSPLFLSLSLLLSFSPFPMPLLPTLLVDCLLCRLC